jgi:hypothetical protein
MIGKGRVGSGTLVLSTAEVAVAVSVGNAVGGTGGKGVMVGTLALRTVEVAVSITALATTWLSRVGTSVSTTGSVSDATADPQATFIKTIKQAVINIQYLGKFLFFTGEL